jgi:hypothetical protein
MSVAASCWSPNIRLRSVGQRLPCRLGYAGWRRIQARRAAPLDNDGRYRFDELRGGEYYLAALAQVADADLADPAFLERLAANAIRVSLALGERKVQDVRLAGR